MPNPSAIDETNRKWHSAASLLQIAECCGTLRNGLRRGEGALICHTSRLRLLDPGKLPAMHRRILSLGDS